MDSAGRIESKKNRSNIEVIEVNEYDGQGEVYGLPDQIELDVILKDDRLLICELKSSISKGGIYCFERKARFCEQRHGRKADRLIVISPIIEKSAEEFAGYLGIETYSDSSEVEEI
ncbi:MAG: hypothetical protein [Olavius algarvensis Gamma 1 endosymbiont]|nr:MAG: hypothetical protein [Olavius algarvensis Gamma 1 endosymbiont]